MKKYVVEKFKKYRENLMVIDDKVYSYATHVATIKYPDIVVPKWHSVTTSKHINYVAKEYNLNVVKEYEL